MGQTTSTAAHEAAGLTVVEAGRRLLRLLVAVVAVAVCILQMRGMPQAMEGQHGGWQQLSALDKESMRFFSECVLRGTAGNGERVYQDVLARPAQLERAAGLPPDRFAQLCARVRTQRDAQQRTRSGRRHTLSLEARVFFSLLRLRTALPFSVLAAVAGVAPSTMHDDFWVVLGCMCLALDPYLQWPDAHERATLSCVATGLEGVVGCVDSTVFAVVPPDDPDERRRYYHYKTGLWGIKVLAVTDLYGRFRYVYAGTPAAVPDNTQFSCSSLGEDFESAQPQMLTTENMEFIVGDSLYSTCSGVVTGFTVKGISVAATHTLRTSRRVFTRLLHRYRNVVENAFGDVKGRYRILCLPYEGDLARFPLVVRVCMQLANFRATSVGPLRDEDYFLREEVSRRDWDVPDSAALGQRVLAMQAESGPEWQDIVAHIRSCVPWYRA